MPSANAWMDLRHYLDLLAQFPERSPKRPTYDIHVNAEITLKRIQKSYRIPVAEALADAIDRTLTSVSNTEWNGLVFFPSFYHALFGLIGTPKYAGSFLSSVICANLRRLTRPLPILTHSASSCRVIKFAERRPHLRTSALTSTRSLC